MRVLIFENSYRDLALSRIPLGSFFEKKEHFVSYACPSPPSGELIYKINLSRNRVPFFSLIKAILSLKKIEREERIDCVLSFRLTPNILNYFASFFGRKRNRVAVITGLGYAFVYRGPKHKLLRFLVVKFYKLAEKRLKIITQNPDDLVDLGLRSGEVIFGSGIANRASETCLRSDVGRLRLLFAGRLLKSKGIDDAIITFKEIRRKTKNATLVIAGDIDTDNPDSLSRRSLNDLKGIEGVEFLDHVNNMDSVYANADVLLFPSRYREGVPRVIIEALSFGLTIVTKNMPGCRETMNNNGILIDENFVREASEYVVLLTEKSLASNSSGSIKLFKEKFSSDVIFPQYLNAILLDR